MWIFIKYLFNTQYFQYFTLLGAKPKQVYLFPKSLKIF